LGIAVAGRPTAAVGVRRQSRISALDFTKGALVLIMVLYHWLNYFIGPHDSRYLRFLTPSFIFITGFLISNVYLAKYKVSDPRLRERLFHRGMKILAVFIILNVIISAFFGGLRYTKHFLTMLFTSGAMSVFVTGNVIVSGVGKGVGFYILVPIAYLLMISSAIFVLCTFYKYAFHAVCAGCLAGILILHLRGIETANLELMAIGLLGVIVGYVPLAKIDAVLHHPWALLGAYIAYLAAITRWNVSYCLQIIGVLLSLGILYLLGTAETGSRWHRQITLLGRYSLFGYIAQIAILQILRRGFRPFNLGPAMLVISFILAVVFTQLSVEITDHARLRSKILDSLYRFVFA
jgi:hypothetical protein